MKEPSSFAHSLVPLKLAAQVVWDKVYRDQAHPSPEANRDDVLDAIASTLAVMGAVYEYDADPGRPARRLMGSELEGGIFRGGAAELRFPDDRVALRRFLAVTAEDVTKTIDALTAAAR